MDDCSELSSISLLNEMCIRDRLFTLVTKGKLDIDTAAEEAGVSVSEFEKLMNEAGYKAVSYTHLDVYKRQQ